MLRLYFCRIKNFFLLFSVLLLCSSCSSHQLSDMNSPQSSRLIKKSQHFYRPPVFLTKESYLNNFYENDKSVLPQSNNVTVDFLLEQVLSRQQENKKASKDNNFQISTKKILPVLLMNIEKKVQGIKIVKAKDWLVLVGVYDSYEEAEKYTLFLKERIKEQPFIILTKERKRYAVVFNFSNKRTASLFCSSLKEKFNIDAYLLKNKGKIVISINFKNIYEILKHELKKEGYKLNYYIPNQQITIKRILYKWGIIIFEAQAVDERVFYQMPYKEKIANSTWIVAF